MDNSLSKIENFIFDILGLALPGLIFLTILLSPLIIINISNIPLNTIENSTLFSTLFIVSKFVKQHWAINSTNVIVFGFILSYLIGHLIKVLSIIKYEILKAIFDKTLNVIAIFCFNSFISLMKLFIRKLIKRPNTKLNIFYNWLKNALSPLKSILSKLFTFDPPNFYHENNLLKNKCIEIINSSFAPKLVIFQV